MAGTGFRPGEQHVPRVARFPVNAGLREGCGGGDRGGVWSNEPYIPAAPGPAAPAEAKPGTNLPHRVDVLELVRRLNREHQRTVVMVLHDVPLAGRYSDHIVAIRTAPSWHRAPLQR
ncbi:hypothetical protein [Pseudarthrobacter sp. L1SW]|uniref:hypothetical protein n=1 Tax=Pseudarthrobacter sp. L1SW TaxID=2851598 RepID=UPI001E4A8922|nr:hypothetical protein [Pseudarthrobacter sp. L1SW]UEL27767.1 hypothetical protein KTR40_14375 [Pseudarthrobacter sp. L1SW]